MYFNCFLFIIKLINFKLWCFWEFSYIYTYLLVGIWQSLGMNILKPESMGTSKWLRRGEGILRGIRVFSTQKVMTMLWCVLVLNYVPFLIHLYTTIFELVDSVFDDDISILYWYWYIVYIVFGPISQNGNCLTANLDLGIHGNNIVSWLHYSGNVPTGLMPWNSYINTDFQVLFFLQLC